MRLAAIFASDLAGGFGLNGGLPWPPLPEDFKHFKEISLQYKNMIMGRETAKTLPKLPGRNKWVVTSSEPSGFEYDNCIGGAYLDKFLDTMPGTGIIIGGPSLLLPKYLDRCCDVYHTSVKGVFKADTFIRPETLSWFGENQNYAEIIKETENCIIRRYSIAKY